MIHGKQIIEKSIKAVKLDISDANSATDPASRGFVTDNFLTKRTTDDVEITDYTKGIILTTPNGSKVRLRIGDDLSFITEVVFDSNNFFTITSEDGFDLTDDASNTLLIEGQTSTNYFTQEDNSLFLDETNNILILE